MRDTREVVDRVVIALKTPQIVEDAAVNNAGGGAVAAIGVGPDGEPPMGKKAWKKYKKDNKSGLPTNSLLKRK